MSTRKSKHCPDCGENRPLDEFGKNIRNVGGRATYCLEHAQMRVRAWKDDNPGKVKEQMQRYIERVKQRNKLEA